MDLPFIPLADELIRLEPLAPPLHDDVRAALDGDEEIWAILMSPGFGPHFERWWENALADNASGRRMAYAVRRAGDGRVVGTTSYLDIRPADDAVEIGFTYYSPTARGGWVNPACKRLMLTHAFDSGAERVQFKVDHRNARSQAAVLRLGAQREGLMRRNVVTWTGHRRSTVFFSILRAEWPAVRAGLDARLAT